MKRLTLLVVLGLVGVLVTGCGSRLTTYTKPDAPWGAIEKVAVLPFALPSENPVRRQLVTELFAEELRRAGIQEVVEVPLLSPVGGVPTLKELSKNYQVDAVFSGSIDDSQGTVVHIRLHDAATGEVLWSGTYLLGVGPEFFSLKTQQQQFQRSVQRMVREFNKDRSS